MLKSRLNASTLLAVMFDRKQNILLTKMLNTRQKTWGAKRFNIVELTNVVQQSFGRGLIDNGYEPISAREFWQLL